MNGTQADRYSFRLLFFISIVSLLGTISTSAESIWQIEIASLQQEMWDEASLIVAGTTEAVTGYDSYDVFLPPAFPNRCLELYTQHSDTQAGWQKQPDSNIRYRCEYLPPLDGSDHTIDFMVKTTMGGIIYLIWDQVTDPYFEDYTVELWQGSQHKDMKVETNHNLFLLYPGEIPLQLKIALQSTPTPTMTEMPTFAPTYTMTPTLTPTPTLPLTSTPTITPTPTATTAPERWEILFEMENTWQLGPEYFGPTDIDKDTWVNETDLMIHLIEWRE